MDFANKVETLKKVFDSMRDFCILGLSRIKKEGSKCKTKTLTGIIKLDDMPKTNKEILSLC